MILVKEKITNEELKPCMTMYQELLSSGRWFKFSLTEQLANIGRVIFIILVTSH